ncbi:AMP-binding protein [Streptomyces orinoci]|uniref:AMP-binding protein n=1 Tax=Streptomyces orinoci TaxID=67339 RepID=A0ABV3K6F3_STRON|nr:AMP-binding protein [Streptomyces orinoci]
MSSPNDRDDFVSYPAAILDALSAAPERTAVTTADGARITAGEFRDLTWRLAGELIERGVTHGSTVTLLTGNTAEALAARYAAGLAGARVVGLYDGMSPETMARIVASVEAVLVLVDGERHAAAKELLALPGLPPALALGPSSFAEDVLAAAARQEARPPSVRVRPEDDWCIRHTGGTTGIPKGIRSLHGPYREALEMRFEGAGEAPRYLACTPLAHLAGLFADAALLQGGSVVLQRDFDPGEVLAAVEREGITHLWLLPPLIYRLLDHPALPRTDLSTLGRISYGGCAASPARLRQAAEAFGPVLYGLYGLSEAQAITQAAPHEHSVTGPDGRVTVGRALPGVEIVVRDPSGADLPAGQQGEIVVRTPGMMAGYWKRPDATAEVLRDGWLYTGDLGYLDENGYLFVVDRIKEKIIVVGGHVYPSEVEELLLSHPAVAQCAVFGVQDEDAAEHVHAAIVPAPGERPDPSLIREFVTARKGRIYAPEGVHLLPSIPLTSVGKPDRKRLGAMFGG